MKHFGNYRLQESLLKLNPCFYYLAVVGFLECLLMAGGIDYYYEHKNYLLFPVFMFFGAAFTQNLTPSAKRKLLIGTIVFVWFLVIQRHRSSMGWKLYPFSWFPAVYLMAYPFASIMQDDERVTGLKIYAGCFLSAASLLVVYGALLLLDKIPANYSAFIYFHEGSRFALMWNPNITGCIFVVATILCVVFSSYSQKKCNKCIFWAFAIVFFINLALTNSRTVIIAFCAVLGGVAFFCVFKRNLKSFFISILAATLVLIVSFYLSECIYRTHTQRLVTKYTQQLEDATEPTTSATEPLTEDIINYPKNQAPSSTEISLKMKDISWENGMLSNPCSTMSAEDINRQLRIIGFVKDRRTFINHFGTLNGRLPLWRCAIRAIREDPSILQWGCEHVGDTISLYSELPFMHSHNSWIEILLSLGLPGFIIALIYTWIAVYNSMVLLWNQAVPLWKKTVALLLLGLLLAGFMEPYLFFSNQFFHFIDFTFFLCLGYVRVWVEVLPRKFDIKKFPFCLL